MYFMYIGLRLRDGMVLIDAECYGVDVDGLWEALGGPPTLYLPARSKGHDWLGDFQSALATWTEMSLMSRESLSGVSEKDA
jgi:hypothetical protein